MNRWMMIAGVCALTTSAWAQDEGSSSGGGIEEPAFQDGESSGGMEQAVSSAGQNMHGGRLGTATQLILSTGYPHGIRADFRFAWNKFEVAPMLAFDYGNNRGLGIDLGTFAGIYFRANVFSQDIWDVSIRFGTRFDFRFTNNFQFGVNLGDPGVRVSANIKDVVDIDFGLDFVPQLQFGPRPNGVGFSFGVPLLFGVEGNIVPGVQLGFTGRGGPNIALNPAGNVSVGPWVEFLFHVGITLGRLKSL